MVPSLWALLTPWAQPCTNLTANHADYCGLPQGHLDNEAASDPGTPKNVQRRWIPKWKMT